LKMEDAFSIRFTFRDSSPHVLFFSVEKPLLGNTFGGHFF